MRRRFRMIKEQVFKVLGLLLLGAALLWVSGKKDAALRFLNPDHFRWLELFLWGLFAIYAVSLLESIVHSGWLKRFDPADPESLKKLNQMRRFHPGDRKKKALQKEEDLMDAIHIYLRSRGFEEQIRKGFGLIYERQLTGVDRHLKPRWQRVFLLYRPILNVLIIDQMLKEAIEFIDRQEPKAVMNQYLLVTDMHNEQEVLSAAAGVVNFLGSLEKAYLSPILIDQKGGRIFFPYDRSLLSFRQKLFHDFLRWDFLRFLTNRERRIKGGNLLKKEGIKPQRKAPKQRSRQRLKELPQRRRNAAAPKAVRRKVRKPARPEVRKRPSHGRHP